MRECVLVGLWVLGLCGCGRADVPDAGGAPGGPPAVVAGETTYVRFCFSCHAAGVAGAPRVGDPVVWAPRIAKGADALLAATVNGVAPGMPARGMCLQCTDADLAAAIDHMIDKSR